MQMPLRHTHTHTSAHKLQKYLVLAGWNRKFRSHLGSRVHFPTESYTGAAMSDIVRMGSFRIQKPGTIPGVEMMGFESFYNARRHNFSRGRTTVADWDVHEVQSNLWRKPLALRARSAPPFCSRHAARFSSQFGNMFTYRLTIASQVGGL
jgi:hypothetical protein